MSCYGFALVSKLRGLKGCWLTYTGASLTLIVTRGVIQDLYQVRKETQIKHEENNERIISQGTEDGIC